MPYRKRPRVEPTDDWSPLRLQLTWPEQASYELIRPVVLFGFSPAERAKQTGVPERTLHRKADRFDAEGSGMASPRAWAVLRLMTKSNFVGRSTGRLAGRAPLRSLST